MYNIDAIVQYSTDEEYQQSLMNVFGLDTYDVDSLEEYNEEYYNKMTIGMDEIYEKTKNVKAFQSLYEKAAASLISTDLKFGIVVLVSYSYFDLFHYLVCDYIKNERIDEELYSTLLKKFKKSYLREE